LHDGGEALEANVLEVFDALIQAMNIEKARLADERKRMLFKARRIEQLIKQAQRLQEAWKNLDTCYAPPEPIPGDDEDDSPELALVEKIFHGRHRTRKSATLQVTPQNAYRLPILEALEQLNGRGRVQEVLTIVYEKLEERLTQDDLEPLPSGEVNRWTNKAMWERLRMVHEGLLRNDSPKGVWEITEAGRLYLRERTHQPNEDDKA